VAADRAAAIGRVIDNLCRIMVMVTEQIANPTQANIDAIVAAASAANIVTPRLDYSVDGESYNWSSYLQTLGSLLEQLRKVEALLSSPFEIRSRGIS